MNGITILLIKSQYNHLFQNVKVPNFVGRTEREPKHLSMLIKFALSFFLKERLYLMEKFKEQKTNKIKKKARVKTTKESPYQPRVNPYPKFDW